MKTARFGTKWREFTRVLGTEYRNIFGDGGLILVLVIAMILYATLYSLAYRGEVLRDIPVAVVDLDMSPSSRGLVRTIDAAPNVRVARMAASVDEARALFYGREVNAVVYIPADYERTLLRGDRQATVGVYVDASYFLMYRQAYQDIATAVMATGAAVSYVKLLAAGVPPPQAGAVVRPVDFSVRNLYNPALGYGSFVIPAIIMVIIQQTLLVGLGMIGGTWREFGLYRKLATPGERRLSTVPIVLGRAVACLSIYAVTATWVLGAHYRFLGYPMNGSATTIVAFMLPYILACIFFGIAVSTLFRRRENSIMLMLWTSVPMLIVSGASIPREALPEWIYLAGKVFPSSSGVEGFLRIQTMGAELRDVMPQLLTLWALCVVYFVMACFGVRRSIELTVDS